jgi:hypothetical protein
MRPMEILYPQQTGFYPSCATSLTWVLDNLLVTQRLVMQWHKR